MTVEKIKVVALDVLFGIGMFLVNVIGTIIVHWPFPPSDSELHLMSREEETAILEA